MAARFSVSGGDSNLLVLKKGNELYIYHFDDQNKEKILRELGKDASDPGLSFNWYDAAVLSKGARQLAP